MMKDFRKNLTLKYKQLKKKQIKYYIRKTEANKTTHFTKICPIIYHHEILLCFIFYSIVLLGKKNKLENVAEEALLLTIHLNLNNKIYITLRY